MEGSDVADGHLLDRHVKRDYGCDLLLSRRLKVRFSLPLSLVVLALICGSLTGVTLSGSFPILEKLACVVLVLGFACLGAYPTIREDLKEEQEEDLYGIY